MIELDNRPFALPALIDNSISIIRTGAEAKGLTVNVQVEPILASYHVGDEARLRQVLLNLFNNAVKFKATGSVSLSGSLMSQSAEAEHLRFERSKQDRLFQHFSQADASVSREYGGTGLGLAICKQLVELMGGRIGVVSALGRGSTFWFEVELPVSEKPAVPELTTSV